MKSSNLSLLRSILLWVLVLFLSACYNPPQYILLAPQDGEQADSASAALSRPYGIGYNLLVHADSLLLVGERPMHWSEGVAESSDSLWLQRHDAIVIAALTVIPEDSIDSVWVKVARDQVTMGWLHESSLLEATVPHDPISQFILFFSNGHVLWFLIVLALVVLALVIRRLLRQPFRMVLVDDIPSVYPTLLTCTLAVSAILYAFIQHDAAQMWAQFFYHPTLNPFSQPTLLCAFLLSVWLLMLLSIAVIDDVLRSLSSLDAALYLFSLLGICMVLYLVLSLPPVQLALLLGIAYIALAVYRYWFFARPLYLCGRCHGKLRRKGVCPYCGAVNE